MARSFTPTLVLLLALVVAFASLASAAGPGRRALLNASGAVRNSDMPVNSLRASLATSDMIARAADRGADMWSTRGAAAAGNSLGWAAAQSDQNIFDRVERAWTK